jgi:hypothetical protein
MPTEICALIGSYCDLDALKSLRLASKSCRYAVEPEFDVCLEHVYLEISLREFNASAQRFQALCEDDRRRKLVKKVTVSVVKSCMSFEVQAGKTGWVLSERREPPTQQE